MQLVEKHFTGILYSQEYFSVLCKSKSKNSVFKKHSNKHIHITLKKLNNAHIDSYVSTYQLYRGTGLMYGIPTYYIGPY